MSMMIPSVALLTRTSMLATHQSFRMISSSSLPQNLNLKDIKFSRTDDGIAVISLDRPVARNAFSKSMAREFTSIVDFLRDDRESRVVVIESSVEKVFCAGADLKERLTMEEHEVGPFVEGLRRMFTGLEKLPMPTIAAVEGAALGGGLELAMCCDLRVAGSGALFGLPETSLAIIPGAGGTQRLPRLIGVARAKELIFTADRIVASRAEAIGLVNHAVPAGEATSKALEIARAIAKNGPVAVRMAKAAVSAGMQCDLATAMDVERGCYAQVITTKDRTEGLLAFREKRKPEYRGE
eukprot:CAMPEP_0171600700 /NCGR_PEP_ID=MMETSP0990-20121206/4483_1 /TAXON_ID=483369 /ORGANISM="non described non described, Strain CCMP2098" /LENGTH=295 /DNA_ID=CAMNT_0012162715 /DNA_START=24 /DNA_END=911 /DNA_ORIENTATION=-